MEKQDKVLAARLASNLLQARERLKLHQQGLAERIGMSKAYLSQIEMGKRLPSLSILVRIAEALNVEVRDLI